MFSAAFLLAGEFGFRGDELGLYEEVETMIGPLPASLYMLTLLSECEIKGITSEIDRRYFCPL